MAPHSFLLKFQIVQRLRNDYLLTYNGGFQIDKDGPRIMLSAAGLTEEGVEGVGTLSHGLVAGHLTIGLDAVLQAVQLPAGIAYLDTGLANMDWDAFTLQQKNI